MTKMFVVDFEATMPQDNPGSSISDIVQVGMAIIDCTVPCIENTVTLDVQPWKTVVGPALTALTGITPERAVAGMSLQTVVGLLPTTWLTLRHPWASWGYYDKRIIAEVCERYCLKNPFGGEHYNIKRLYWLLCQNGRERQLSLRKAVAREKMLFVGQPHDAGNDAVMAAKILLRLMEKHNA